MIKKYCITNGTVNRAQSVLYEGGSLPGHADIQYAVKKTYSNMSRGSMSGYRAVHYAASYSGFSYNDSVFCYGKTMFQNASGREIPCYQILLCDKSELWDGNVFIDEVVDFSFLSLDELLASGEYDAKRIFERGSRARINDIVLSETQINNIVKTVNVLLHGKHVVLQLPYTERYEELSLVVLEEVYQLIPKRDRCNIAFSTARNANDIRTIGSVFQLILTDDQTEKMNDAEWIRLNDGEPLKNQELCIAHWRLEKEKNRLSVENCYFTFFEKQADPLSYMRADYEVLERLYSASSLWWDNTNPERRFKTFDQVVSETKTNPTLSIDANRKKFFGRIEKMICNLELEDLPKEQIVLELLSDYLFLQQVDGQKKNMSLFEDEKRYKAFLETCQSDYAWFGLPEKLIGDCIEELDLFREMLLTTEIA